MTAPDGPTGYTMPSSTATGAAYPAGQTMYLLTAGSYSAYSVQALFASEAEAMKCAALDDDLTVERFTLYVHAPEPLIVWDASVDNIKHRREYHGMTVPGEVRVHRQIVWPWDEVGYPAVPGGWPGWRASLGKVQAYPTSEGALYVRTWQPTEELATKIAADTYAAEMVKHGLGVFEQ